MTTNTGKLVRVGKVEIPLATAIAWLGAEQAISNRDDHATPASGQWVRLRARGPPQ